VPQIGGQERKFRLKIGILLVPECEPQHCPGMTEVVHAKTSASAHVRDASDVERLMKRGSQRGGRVPATGTMRKERRVRLAGA
jgi:hypothetical protein